MPLAFLGSDLEHGGEALQPLGLARQALGRVRELLGGGEELLRHLRYTIDLVGAEHVGLGLDYVFDRSELDEHIRNYPGSYPPGTSSARDIAMVEPEAMSAIVEGLCRDGLTDGEIQGVLGGNLLRLASQVWK